VRVGETIGATTTDYVVDLAATLPVVISDTDAVYLYGLDILAEQLAGAERYYYVHDGLGSVRQLLDSTGQIATKYAYDPFGVPLVGNGVPNPWQFTGEAWDSEVELLYLRARYYQPEAGRFISKDPWGGERRRPDTLNRYVYVTNNPVNLVDHTGLQAEEAWRNYAGRQGPEAAPPLPYDITAFELGWLWLTEQSPLYVVLDENYALTRYLVHDKGVNQARIEFYQRLQSNTLQDGRYSIYGYSYVPTDYVREAAEYLAGYDRVGFFLGSYVVYTRLNSDDGTVTFVVEDRKNLQTFSKSPCYFAPDLIGQAVNPYLPKSLQFQRSEHSLEGLVMGAQRFDFPSDIFLASFFEPRYRWDPGVFGTNVRFGGRAWLLFVWTEPLRVDQRR
jgi:RHS repeat-associated protein